MLHVALCSSSSPTLSCPLGTHFGPQNKGAPAVPPHGTREALRASLSSLVSPHFDGT